MKDKKGFTLTELLAVIVLIGVILAKKDLKRFPEAECLLLTYALEAITLLRET